MGMIDSANVETYGKFESDNLAYGDGKFSFIEGMGQPMFSTLDPTPQLPIRN